MSFEKFQDGKFKKDSLELIEKCNIVIRDYQRQGYTLTLRQLYYQMVARDIIANKQREYKNLGELIVKARLCGMIDWTAIEDRTRNVEHPPAWKTPDRILSAVADQYQENPWLEQEYHVEVWIEKEALVGVIEGVCSRLRVPYFACRGYASISELYDSGKRLSQIHRREGRQPVILHLGDHDPSGIDMTRDNEDRLAMFARMGVEVRRLALNHDQIDEYEPPPNPAKVSDSRFAAYEAQHGDESWELDALEPSVIEGLIEDEIETYRDSDKWDKSIERENAHKVNLQKIYVQYDDVIRFLNDPQAEPPEGDE